MDIAKDIFSKKRVIRDRLKAFGFAETDGTAGEPIKADAAGGAAEADGVLVYTESFMNGDLKAVVAVRPDGSVSCSAIDAASGDAYLPMNIESHVGTYVGEAREEYREILQRIADACFGDVPFLSDQANRIATRIESSFGAAPEFVFKKGKDRDAAIFRHKENGKWFAIVMTVARGKLDMGGTAGSKASGCVAGTDSAAGSKASGGAVGTGGAAGSKASAGTDARADMPLDPEERINVMNVKIDPGELDALLKEPGLCRCYHMNKKLWATIVLDGTCSDNRVMELLRESFDRTKRGTSAGKSGRRTARAGEKAYWLIPSNPANFDVARGFRDGNGKLSWHHRINVAPGDIVYIYQTEPVASIMFECEVLEAFLPRPASWGRYAPSSKYRMILKLLRSFRKGEYPRSWMNEHGVAKTVRGQRSAPAELVSALVETEKETHE